MQFLKIEESTTLAELGNRVGERNVDSILAANNLKRIPQVGKKFMSNCASITSEAKDVEWKQMSAILNSFSGDSDVFEAAALLGTTGWKLLANAGTFPNRLKIPDSITLQDSTDILGSNNTGVSNVIYNKAMTQLKTDPHTIDPQIFNEYSTIKQSGSIDSNSNPVTYTDIFEGFNLPWGKILLYSSLAGETIQFPVFPEELGDEKVANYTTMPDLLYQYEPWQVYQSSGPRANTYTFKFHRDMWTGDHRDGKANDLIRFCEANCYPEYNGSAVNAGTVTLYIGGSALISGVMTSVKTDWSGPIGLDDWYLYCELSISITEVSQSTLSYSEIRNKTLIG